jgi:hypothetical protein
LSKAARKDFVLARGAPIVCPERLLDWDMFCPCVWGADKKGLFINSIYEQLLYCSDVSAF